MVVSAPWHVCYVNDLRNCTGCTDQNTLTNSIVYLICQRVGSKCYCVVVRWNVSSAKTKKKKIIQVWFCISVMLKKWKFAIKLWKANVHQVDGKHLKNKHIFYTILWCCVFLLIPDIDFLSSVKSIDSMHYNEILYFNVDNFFCSPSNLNSKKRSRRKLEGERVAAQCCLWQVAVTTDSIDILSTKHVFW